jgi:hypothetical protein
VGLAVGLLIGIVVSMAVAGFTNTMPVAWTMGVVFGAGATAWTARHPRLGAHVAGVPRTFRITFLTGAAVALGQLAILTAFIVDPNVTSWRDSALRPWASMHSCVSAYWVAAEGATSIPDLYVESVYRPDPPANGARKPNLGPFIVDVFEYPPTFLPVPRLLARATADFWGFRRLWFALNLAGVVIGLVVIARRVDLALGTHTVWLTPWVLAAPSVVGTLQAGNVQLLILVGSTVALLFFERGRPALGGLLLAVAIASKIYPGVLVVYLLLRRDWRAVAWTAAAGLGVLLVTLADVGWTPMAAFLDHLPKILSGEAFPGLYRPAPIAINESIPGIVFKLGLFGVPGMGFPAARVVGWVYTLVLLGAITWFALRMNDRRLDPLVWIAILTLAVLRSPFLPSYGPFPSLWLATLLAGMAWNRPPQRTLAAVAFLVLATSLGQSRSIPVNAVVSFLHTATALLLALAIVPKAGVSWIGDPGPPADPGPRFHPDPLHPRTIRNG